MELIADILLISGALGAGLYCIVLSRRLKRLHSLEKGVGGAVTLLSSQVDELSTSLETARQAAGTSAATLGDLTSKADSVAQRLELLLASMHDVPTSTDATQSSEQQGSTEPAEVVFVHRQRSDAGVG